MELSGAQHWKNHAACCKPNHCGNSVDDVPAISQSQNRLALSTLATAFKYMSLNLQACFKKAFQKANLRSVPIKERRAPKLQPLNPRLFQDSTCSQMPAASYQTF